MGEFHAPEDYRYRYFYHISVVYMQSLYEAAEIQEWEQKLIVKVEVPAGDESIRLINTKKEDVVPMMENYGMEVEKTHQISGEGTLQHI